jgi:hypothetical protein
VTKGGGVVNNRVHHIVYIILNEKISKTGECKFKQVATAEISQVEEYTVCYSSENSWKIVLIVDKA